MKAVAIPTSIFQPGEDLFAFLQKHIPVLEEESVVIITSKILSFAQNRFVKAETHSREEKQLLAQKEADWFLDPSSSKYGVMLTIKGSHLAVNAGIDESNSEGKYLLWPENLQETTNKIWHFLRQTYGVKKLGIIVTDSKTIPLRWGVTGTAIAHCGFLGLINKIGQDDIFGKKLEMTQINVAEAVAIAGVFEMGEGNEQRPLAVVTDFHQPIEFQDHSPSTEELKNLVIAPEDDVYAPVLMSVPWKKGGE